MRDRRLGLVSKVTGPVYKEAKPSQWRWMKDSEADGGDRGGSALEVGREAERPDVVGVRNSGLESRSA